MAPRLAQERVDAPESQPQAFTKEEAKGQVVVLLAYQAFCPACHRHALPLYAQLEKRYAKRKDVRFLYLHSVFEGFSHNTFEAAVAKARKAGVKGAVVEDIRMNAAKIPEMFRALGARATPTSFVVDRRGRLSFSAVTPKRDKLVAAIDKALRSKAR